jgi:hypothetical protein
MLRGVYPERTAEILRCAQDDSEGLSMTGNAAGRCCCQYPDEPHIRSGISIPINSKAGVRV